MTLVNQQIDCGSFYTIHLHRRKIPIQGILINYGSEWVLLKYVPVDYVLDGYVLIRTRYIKRIERGEEEIFHEKVIRTKYSLIDSKKNYLSLDGIHSVLNYLKENEIVIQFDFSDESVAYLGRIEKLNPRSIQITSLDPKGNWDEESSYKLETIRTIQFDNDYINSLVLYNKTLI